MAATEIITESGRSIIIHHDRYSALSIYYTTPSEYWCFSVNVERYRYKKVKPLIRYNAEIVAKRFGIQDPTPKEEILIYRSNRRGLEAVDKAYKLLQSLLQVIDNGDPVWDVRELL